MNAFMFITIAMMALVLIFTFSFFAAKAGKEGGKGRMLARFARGMVLLGLLSLLWALCGAKVVPDEGEVVNFLAKSMIICIYFMVQITVYRLGEEVP